jgi:hypothetical protein
MFKHLSAFTLKPNSILSRTDFNQLRFTEVLDTLTLTGVQFTKNFVLDDLKIQNNGELTSIVLTNSEGLYIPDGANNTSPRLRPIPHSWAALTKLKTINMADCGLTQEQLGYLVVDLAERVGQGLGSAATGKALILNGGNATLLLTNAAVSAAKTYLISKGWAVTHL